MAELMMLIPTNHTVFTLHLGISAYYTLLIIVQLKRRRSVFETHDIIFHSSSCGISGHHQNTTATKAGYTPEEALIIKNDI
jgi:hypothetical protein